MKIGDRLKQLRNAKNISTYALAERTGISQSTISKLENNKRRMDLDTLEKIADALGVSLDYLTRKSAKAVIEDRLEEIGITLGELSNKTKIPVRFFESLDTIDPDEEDYERLKVIAAAIGVDSTILMNSLYRQEPPGYDGPYSSATEAFSKEEITDDESSEPPIRSLNKHIEKNKIKTIAAHFEGEDFTEEDVEDIKNFIDFVLTKKKNKK